MPRYYELPNGRNGKPMAEWTPVEMCKLLLEYWERRVPTTHHRGISDTARRIIDAADTAQDAARAALARAEE